MLKPMDIHNKEFKRVMRGYDVEEVDEFLDEIIVDFEPSLSKKMQEYAHPTFNKLFMKFEKYFDHTILKPDATVLSSINKDGIVVTPITEFYACKVTMQNNSKDNNIDVIGQLVTPQKSPAMHRAAHIEVGIPSKDPSVQPRVEPITKAGIISPPLKPQPMVSAVRISFMIKAYGLTSPLID